MNFDPSLPNDSRRNFVKKSLAASIIAAQPTILAGLIRAQGGGGATGTTDPWGGTEPVTESVWSTEPWATTDPWATADDCGTTGFETTSIETSEFEGSNPIIKAKMIAASSDPVDTSSFTMGGKDYKVIMNFKVQIFDDQVRWLFRRYYTSFEAKLVRIIGGAEFDPVIPFVNNKIAISRKIRNEVWCDPDDGALTGNSVLLDGIEDQQAVNGIYTIDGVSYTLRILYTSPGAWTGGGQRTFYTRAWALACLIKTSDGDEGAPVSTVSALKNHTVIYVYPHLEPTPVPHSNLPNLPPGHHHPEDAEKLGCYVKCSSN